MPQSMNLGRAETGAGYGYGDHYQSGVTSSGFTACVMWCSSAQMDLFLWSISRVATVGGDQLTCRLPDKCCA
jgi:hypothetical protein